MNIRRLLRRGDFWLAFLLCIFAVASILLTYNVGGSKWGGIWAGGRIGSGFLPLVSGSMLIICNLFWIRNMITEEKKTDEPIEKSEMYISVQIKENGKKKIYLSDTIKYLVILPIFLIIMVKMIEILGMYFIMTLFLFTWFMVIDKFGFLKSIVLTVCIMVVLYLVFTVWLQVPYPSLLDLF